MKLEEYGPQRQPKQFVLCFDGTGNKFVGDTSDTNIVKIYRVRLTSSLRGFSAEFQLTP